jgi:hypothetical protein
MESNLLTDRLGGKEAWRRVGQISQKCKETSNLMLLLLIWFISFLFVCCNLFCTIANLRIKCVTETKNVSVLFYKKLSTWLTHLNLRFLYIIGCSGPRCGVQPTFHNMYQIFFLIFPMISAMATLGLKEMEKFLLEGREKSAQLAV